MSKQIEILKSLVPPQDLECANLSCDIVYYKPPPEPSDERLKEQYDLIETHLIDTKFDSHASSYLIVRSKSSPGHVFVVFRGTQNLSDMIADFNCQPREIDCEASIGPSLFVHGGIYETSKQSMKQIIPRLNTLHSNGAITDLFFTGHSLGGACAAAARLFSLQQDTTQPPATETPELSALRRFQFAPRFHIVTFGAPLLFSSGPGQAAKEAKEAEQQAEQEEGLLLLKHPWLKAIKAETRAYVHESDIVPRILGRKDPGEDGKGSWEAYLRRNVFQGLAAATVSIVPSASANVASAAAVAAFALSPAVALAAMSAVYHPLLGLPCLLVAVPMMAASDTIRKPIHPELSESNSELEVRLEHFVGQTISFAILQARGHRLLESPQLSGYFPVGSLRLLRAASRPRRRAPAPPPPSAPTPTTTPTTPTTPADANAAPSAAVGAESEETAAAAAAAAVAPGGEGEGEGGEEEEVPPQRVAARRGLFVLEDLPAQRRALEVPHGVPLHCCVAHHGARGYLERMLALHRPPPARSHELPPAPLSALHR